MTRSAISLFPNGKFKSSNENQNVADFQNYALYREKLLEKGSPAPGLEFRIGVEVCQPYPVTGKLQVTEGCWESLATRAALIC